VEVVLLIVIPSKARDPLFRNTKKKQIPRAKPALGMTVASFASFPQRVADGKARRTEKSGLK
jgi:hypothetical protein